MTQFNENFNHIAWRFVEYKSSPTIILLYSTIYKINYLTLTFQRNPNFRMPVNFIPNIIRLHKIQLVNCVQIILITKSCLNL